MVDRTLKQLQAMLSKMAYEDPNAFIHNLYHSGMGAEDIEDIHYLIVIARRAPGYDPEKDLFLSEGIF